MYRGFDAVPEVLRPLMQEALVSSDTVELHPHESLVDCAVYAEGHRMPGKCDYTEALSKVREIELLEHDGFVWVGLHEPDEAQMQEVADVFGLHPLAVEDAVCAHQRPKIERYDDTLVLVLKTVNYVQHESVVAARQIVETGEIMVFVGQDFVITVRHGEHGGLSDVRKRLDTTPDQLQLGPFAVMHAIADDVVDHYLTVSALMQSDIDSIEEVAFSSGRQNIEPIYLLKREVVELRRCVAPLSVAFHRMQMENKDLISKELRRYLRDVSDHQTQAADQIASYDDMLTSLVQAALARVGMQQNDDMRKMAAWAAILAVPTMIAAIYGMNFKVMPELNWTWGYPGVMAGMTVACVFLYYRFRNNNWL